MGWHQVLAAVRALLAADFPGVPIAYQNESFAAPDGLSWAYLELLPVGGDTTLFGSTGLRVRAADGLIAAHVFVPTGTGADVGFQLAEQLGEILQLRTLAAGVETGGYELSGAGSGDDEGNYFRTGLTVPVSIHSTT
jgi:hypothetical protein